MVPAGAESYGRWRETGGSEGDCECEGAREGGMDGGMERGRGERVRGRACSNRACTVPFLPTSVPYYKKVGGVKYSSSSGMMSDSPIVVCVGRILVPVLIDRKGYNINAKQNTHTTAQPYQQ